MEILLSNEVAEIETFAEDRSFFEATSQRSCANPAVLELAKEILAVVFQYKRSAVRSSACEMNCPSCYAPHLSKVINAIEAAQPITFVLPAFPGKSPNHAKVLGSMPDMAEKLALEFLQRLCQQIREVYIPGAEVIICSDGRVFSDVVGMKEDDVTDYQTELQQIIEQLKLSNLSTFNLDHLCDENDFVPMRRKLMQRFGVSLDEAREKVLRDSEAHRMFCGITRFLVEDASFPGQLKSRSALQKECKAKAYEVIRRSNAWSDLIAERFPEAVRLSIHPQGCGAEKLGLRLIGSESWMTPWHGVAVKIVGGFTLLKRSEAEALGARLVYLPNGRASHFELKTEVEP